MIYAVGILRAKFVKIGFTEGEVRDRIASLQTASPFEITEIVKTDGSLVQEKQIHKALFAMFARIRIPIPPNEWYPGRNEPFKKFLDALYYGPNAALAVLDRYDQMVKQPGDGASSLMPNIRWASISEERNIELLRNKQNHGGRGPTAARPRPREDLSRHAR